MVGFSAETPGRSARGTPRKNRGNMQAIVITGMHRSGTSLVAEILTHAGVHFGAPEHWLPPDASNPHGYFEDRRVVDLDDRLLRLWKGTWDEPPLLPPNWLEEAGVQTLAGEASVWRDSVATEEQWGWKDPRASLLLPFWRRLVPGLRCVLCVRDPLEVAVHWPSGAAWSRARQPFSGCTI